MVKFTTRLILLFLTEKGKFALLKLGQGEKSERKGEIIMSKYKFDLEVPKLLQKPIFD